MVPAAFWRPPKVHSTGDLGAPREREQWLRWHPGDWVQTVYQLIWKWFNILIAGVALSAEAKPWVQVSQIAGNSLTSQGHRSGKHQD